MKKTLLLLAAIAAWSTIEVSAFYNPSTGRWLSRDLREEGGEPNLYTFVNNTPLNALDPYGSFTLIDLLAIQTTVAQLTPMLLPQLVAVKPYLVPRCTVEILVGHNRRTAPHVPFVIKNDPCSATSIVACDGGTIEPSVPIPGIDPRPEGNINLVDAGELALSDFSAGQAYAKNGICKMKKCGCGEVTVTINCIGITAFERLAMPHGVCGKQITVNCQPKEKLRSTSNSSCP